MFWLLLARLLIATIALVSHVRWLTIVLLRVLRLLTVLLRWRLLAVLLRWLLAVLWWVAGIRHRRIPRYIRL